MVDVHVVAVETATTDVELEETEAVPWDCRAHSLWCMGWGWRILRWSISGKPIRNTNGIKTVGLPCGPVCYRPGFADAYSSTRTPVP